MNNFQIHTDFMNGYRLGFPPDWEKQPLAPNAMAFLAPRESSADIFRENVNISMHEIAVTLAQHVDLQVNLMGSAPGAQLRLLHRGDALVAGVPAQRLEFTGRLGPVMKPDGSAGFIPMQWLQVYALKGAKMYCFTYTAEDRAYQKFLPVVLEMLNSLELS